MVTLKLTVILHSADEGGFTVKCLDIPVASEGETKEEALSNIKEAIEGYLEAKEISRSVQEMKKGDCVTLEELKSA